MSVPIKVDDAASMLAALSTPVVDRIEVTVDVDLSEATVEKLTFSTHKVTTKKWNTEE